MSKPIKEVIINNAKKVETIYNNHNYDDNVMTMINIQSDIIKKIFDRFDLWGKPTREIYNVLYISMYDETREFMDEILFLEKFESRHVISGNEVNSKYIDAFVELLYRAQFELIDIFHFALQLHMFSESHVNGNIIFNDFPNSSINDIHCSLSMHASIPKLDTTNLNWNDKKSIVSFFKDVSINFSSMISEVLRYDQWKYWKAYNPEEDNVELISKKLINFIKYMSSVSAEITNKIYELIPKMTNSEKNKNLIESLTLLFPYIETTNTYIFSKPFLNSYFCKAIENIDRQNTNY